MNIQDLVMTVDDHDVVFFILIEINFNAMFVVAALLLSLSTNKIGHEEEEVGGVFSSVLAIIFSFFISIGLIIIIIIIITILTMRRAIKK